MCSSVHRLLSVCPHVLVLALLSAGMILMAGLAFVWSVCAFSIVYAVDNGSSSNAYSVRGLIFFALALSLFWTILAIKVPSTLLFCLLCTCCLFALC
jgi:hypothetical protein